MVADIAAVSYVLSSVASVGRVLETVLNFSKAGALPTLDQLKNIESRVQQDIRIETDSGIFNQPELARNMSDSALKKIKTVMDRISVEIEETIEDLNMPDKDRNSKINSSVREYCFQIHLMKRFCGQTLPPRMEKEWDRVNCKQFHFP